MPWEGDYDLFLAGRSISLVLYLTNICTHELRDCPLLNYRFFNITAMANILQQTKKINLVAQNYQMSPDDLRLM